MVIEVKTNWLGSRSYTTNCIIIRNSALYFYIIVFCRFLYPGRLCFQLLAYGGPLTHVYHPGLGDMHSFAVGFPKTLYATAPVAGRSLGPQVLQSARYISQLPVTMILSLDCLKQNCSNYGDSYDDSQKKIVPNSQSDRL